MSGQMKALIAVLITGVVMTLVLIISLNSTYNTMVSQENGVVAQYDQNRNSYDNMWKTFREMTQVATMQTEDVEKVFKGAIEGRYGDNGSQAVFQALKEDNPKLDGAIYKQIQVAVQSGRASFEENQKTLIDKKRAYITYLESSPTNILAKFFGFPRKDMSKYDIVTSGRTESDFASKKGDEVKLR